MGIRHRAGGGGDETILAFDDIMAIGAKRALTEAGLRVPEDVALVGFDNIEVRNMDGYHGWQEHAPFDAIMVTAASSHIPPPLVQQLKPGGILIIPVGPAFQVQQLSMVRKDAEGELTTRQILPVRFVPFTGKH